MDVLGEIIFSKMEINNGIKKTRRTGNNIGRIDISESLPRNNGSRKGMSNAIVKLVNTNESIVYSVFPLRRLVITGAAIAVGAMAVMNEV
jgi:hypothetical protein